MEWRFLIVDDEAHLAAQTADIVSNRRTLQGVKGLDGGQTICCDVVSDFEQAKLKVKLTKYDLAIIDLKDEVSGDELKGKEILDLLRQEHFIPVIFYSGFAEKVEPLRSAFVHPLIKGDDDVERLRGAVQCIFNTRLPQLMRHVQEQQRQYLWDHVQEHWKDSTELSGDGELAYLLARRLSGSLSAESIRGFLNPEHRELGTVHPVEYYIWPSLGGSASLGDIYKCSRNDEYFLLLNPACDLDKRKADNALLVKCMSIESFSEYSDVLELKGAKQEVSKGKRKLLSRLIGDNRDSQPERYKYIPGTSFIPHLVADFQVIKQEPIGCIADVDKYCRVATLDSPFAEAVQARFARYYSRFGVPDLNFENVVDAVISSIAIDGD